MPSNLLPEIPANGDEIKKCNTIFMARRRRIRMQQMEEEEQTMQYRRSRNRPDDVVLKLKYFGEMKNGKKDGIGTVSYLDNICLLYTSDAADE